MISAAHSNGVDCVRLAIALRLDPSQLPWESDAACISTMLSQPPAPTRLCAQPSSQGGQLGTRVSRHAQPDELVGVGPHSGRIDEAGAEPEGTCIEGFLDQGRHCCEVLIACGAGLSAPYRAADGAVGDQWGDVQWRADDLQVVEVLAEALPVELGAARNDERHEGRQGFAVGRGRWRHPESTVADYLGGNSLLEERPE